MQRLQQVYYYLRKTYFIKISYLFEEIWAEIVFLQKDNWLEVKNFFKNEWALFLDQFTEESRKVGRDMIIATYVQFFKLIKLALFSEQVPDFTSKRPPFEFKIGAQISLAHVKYQPKLNKLTFFLKTVVIWYKYLKTLFFPSVVAILLGLLLINFYHINAVRQLAIWLVIGLIFFWLMSGFNFFLKRSRFGKFTSSSQRFWKRANAYFWLIEGFLFSLFFYYYLNSSQEPLYFFDESSMQRTELLALSTSYFTYILLVFLIFYGLYALLTISNSTFRQHLIHILAITLGLLYIFLVESYQFYYVITSFYEISWSFDGKFNIWSLGLEVPRIRVKQQYLTLALVAKYWHFLFIFLSWLFFFVKAFETKKISFVLLGVNVQNLIILFGLNILFSAQWLKWLSRRFFDTPYYWFFADSQYWLNSKFVEELCSFCTAAL